MKDDFERYEDVYSKEGSVFGEPEQLVQNILKHRDSGTVLELGAGQGRNSLYLASKGFDVTAIDRSRTGVEQLMQQAQEQELSIKVKVGDIRTDEIKKEYDIVISTFVLHHLSTSEALDLIQRMQQHTKPGGINVITTFTKDGDFFRKDPETGLFYPEQNGLRKLYTDWDILTYEERERVAHQRNPDGSAMHNTGAHLLAQKHEDPNL